jgi:hypothetical protein
MLEIQCSYVFAHSSGMITVLPSRTAASAGSASGFIFTNHCVEIIGSTTEPVALAARQHQLVRLRAAREALLVERLLHGLARDEAIEAGERAAALVHLAVEVQDVDLLELVALCPSRNR